MNEPQPLDVILVGGAGGMGRYAAAAIARLGTARRLVIADLDLGRAQRVADRIGHPAEPRQLDATDQDAMRVAFSGADAVLNTMGPFARFGLPILRAAIESGCDYLDIDDDWQSTVEALELDADLRARGRRAVIGLGASPGTTNLCARLAAERLDEVRELYTGWSLEAAVMDPDPELPVTGSAAAEHWVHQCSQPLRAWRDGKVAEMAPLERTKLDFPGIGPAVAYTMGHPEPITLPLRYPALRESLNLQCGPAPLFDGLRQVIDAFRSGELTLQDAARLIDGRELDEAPIDHRRLPPLWALATGVRDGQPTTVAVYPRVELPGAMGGNTGTPLAIGLELLRRGRVDGTGVMAPEAALDPDDFFALFGQFQEGDGDPLVIAEA